MANKRLISLALAFACLIGCFVVSSVQGKARIAGAGDGKDTRIETLEEFAELLQYIQGGNGRFDYESEDMLSDASEHTSATVRFSTNLTAESHSDNAEYTGGTIHLKQSVNRELTLYVCEEDTFYVTSGSMTVEKVYLDEDDREQRDSQYMQWDMQIYYSGRRAYILIDQLILATPGQSVQIKTLNRNKWIQIPAEGVSNIVDTEYENREVLSALGELMEILVEYDYTAPGEGSVNLTEEDFISILELEEEETDQWEDIQLDFAVDLSDPTRPWISSIAVTDSTTSQEVATGYYEGAYGLPEPQYTTVNVSQKIKNSQEIFFENIDNTEISFDEDMVEIECDSMKDFEKLCIVKEFEED